MARVRIEKDSMGRVEVPARALYGAQTQRAVENFPISGQGMPAEFIRALALVKWAAAEANAELGLLPKKFARPIAAAAKSIWEGEHADAFPVDVFQTGSGTSSNMNMNEVLATLASRRIAGGKVSPNDHVNMGQSSNDVIPTAIHVAAAVAVRTRLRPELKSLERVLARKARSLRRQVKTGRTHLMDAMPVRMEQEVDAWRSQIAKNLARIDAVMPRLCQLAQGGTAVGSGVNADERFAVRFARILGRKAGIRFSPNPSFFEALSCQDTAVELSGQLKTTAVSFLKIANDLRWMNSGPLAGLGEIELAALQPGSSIMPGKVNPVIPEAAAMVAAQVIGNDATITVAGGSGNFQLNVMLPVIARNLLESIRLLAATAPLLAATVATFKVRSEQLRQPLERNPILVTALNPLIGYLKAAQIAKAAYAQGRPVLDVAAEMTSIPRNELKKLMDPAKLTKGGISG